MNGDFILVFALHLGGLFVIAHAQKIAFFLVSHFTEEALRLIGMMASFTVLMILWMAST